MARERSAGALAAEQPRGGETREGAQAIAARLAKNGLRDLRGRALRRSLHTGATTRYLLALQAADPSSRRPDRRASASRLAHTRRLEGLTLGEKHGIHRDLTDLVELKGPHLHGDAVPATRLHLGRHEHPLAEVAVFRLAGDVALPRLHPVRPPPSQLRRAAGDPSQTRHARLPLDLGCMYLNAGSCAQNASTAFTR